ncbi:ABC transporter substrate-binding protein [Comamonas testosteroni]|jgi:NitT/TauT family transport system substrate-binding protein|uniref:Thiamine pyrimidine synthase n=2 Tax=Comamonas testosteroni TaxID=285 RepID=B7WWT5_COMTK|nr:MULTISPECIES: ABC transporter substrate-binding protein [Comamonas]AIJ46558.1 nitrate ABC transporter substrate-binding protein [Comamonas testosteroni TK102]EED67819.1 NMT1/THI5 like domain protein [Comamonas testosteroni KF-1]MPS89017.1 nitrate ABC transporter substrate-binding protein [Comamonas sp.]TYK73881.1 ABC transporter substrate-binding protein [Comamonas sp. Z3]WQG65945.1 ABC transporter substrate-binding protein [Comamonas testosteroni]
MHNSNQTSFISRRSLLGACAGLSGLAMTGTSMAVPLQGRIRLAGWSKPISEITNILVEPEKGFFKANGVELAYLPGAGGGDAIRNILSGQADVAFTDPGSFFMALDKGEKLVAIYDIYPQNVFNVVSLKSSGIRKPADLKGKKIGVYSLASGTRQNLLVMLHQAGLKESDVSIVVTGLLNFAPLMQGQVDATAATDTGLAVGLRKGIGDVNVMQVSDHLNMSSDMFVVREEVFQQKKDLLKAFIKGYRESAAWMMANPEEASVLASKYAIDGTRRDINLDVIRLRNASSMPAVQGQPLGSFDMVALQKGADAYRALGMVQRQIKVADVVVSL